MSNHAFIDLVRQFASLARRKHTSYADAVDAAAQSRVASIRKEYTDAGERTKALQKLQAFLSNEYQPFDPDFAIKSYD